MIGNCDINIGKGGGGLFENHHTEGVYCSDREREMEASKVCDSIVVIL